MSSVSFHREYSACCAVELPADRSQAATISDRSCASWKCKGNEYLLLAMIEDVDKTVFALAALKKDVPVQERMDVGQDRLIEKAPKNCCRFRLISRDSFPEADSE